MRESQLNTDLLKRVEGALDEFEELWKGSNDGQKPRIEKYLQQTAECETTVKLFYLLATEVELLRKSGHKPAVDEYLARFPDHTSVVKYVFQQLPAQSSDPHATTRSVLENKKKTRTAATTLAYVPCATESEEARRGESLKSWGDYELIEEVARGGMGVVYKARQKSLDRTVALKMILSGRLAGAEEIERFHTEAEAAAKLDHPWIVPVYEVGKHEGQHYLVMGFVEGQSLSARLADGPLLPRESAELTRKVAAAVAYAHEEGIIHRDLKPANVLLDGRGEPRITDFGLAKRLEDDSEITQTGQILGTPAFMSPEQAAGGGEVGPPADVYGLGALLYALLTNRPPFQAATSDDTRSQVLESEPVPPRKLVPNIDRDLETICLKCLQKESRRRYATVKDLENDLQQFLNGEPIQARPIGSLERAIKWSRRHPSGAALIAVSVIATLAIFVGVFSYNAELRTALAQARHQLARNHIQTAGQDLDQGRLIDGMAKLFDAFQATRAEDPMRRSIRGLMAGWGSGLGNTFCHDNGVNAVTFSRDGNKVLTGSMDGTARIWDARSGELLVDSLTHKADVYAVAFSPDDRFVCTGSFDNTARLWDATTGEPVGEPLTHNDRILAVAFSPNGKLLLTASRDGTAKIWDIATTRLVCGALRHANGVFAIAFSPDGTKVATGSKDCTARLWDAATGAAICDPLHHQQMIWDIAFAPDGKTLLTGSWDNTARLWDVETGEQRFQPMQHDGRVYAVAFSPDGKTILTGSADRTARLWDATLGKLIGEVAGNEQVFHVAFDPNGRIFATGGRHGGIQLWDANRFAPMRGPISHGNGIRSMEFSPDGSTLLTGSLDGTARMWKYSANKGTHLIPPEMVLVAAFGPDGSTIACTGGLTGDVGVWNTIDGTPVLDPLNHGMAAVVTLAISPNGSTLLTGCSDGTAWLWDLSTGTPRHLPLQNANYVSTVAFSPDGSLALTGSRDGVAQLWDVVSAEAVGDPMQHASGLNAVAFSPDGKTVLAGCQNGIARLWNLDTYQPIGVKLMHEDEIYDVSFGPGGKVVATASLDRTARLWDAATGKSIAPPLRHEGAVGVVIFSTDGEKLATASLDGTVRLWQVPTGDSIGKPMRHKGPVNHVAFSPDGRLVIAGCNDMTACVWDVSTSQRRGEPLRHKSQVKPVAFSPDGSKVISGGGDGARLWNLPQAVPDEPARIQLWIEVQTVRKWGDDSMATSPLSFAEWLTRQRRLQSLGGAPIQ